MENLGFLQSEGLKENKSNQIYLLDLRYVALDVTARVSCKWYISTIFIF